MFTILISFLAFALNKTQIHAMEGQNFTPVPRKQPYHSQDFPNFKVKHDYTYKQKWIPVFEKKQNEFNLFVEAYVKLVENNHFVSKEFLKELQNIKNSKFAENYPEMIEEMEAISEVSNTPFIHIVYLNFVYELFSHQRACTTIVVKNSQGDIFHGRNLDYFLQQHYSDNSIQFDFYDENDKKVYSSGQYVGYVISHTGIKYGKYSITLNQRSTGSSKDSIEQFKKGACSNIYLTPLILRSTDSFEKAQRMLEDTPLIASSYYIISGTKEQEGRIIERNRDSINSMYNLTENNWFLVITNSDLDHKDPDTRRDKAIQKIKEIGPEITIDQLYDEILTQYPNFNIETVSTSLLDAKKEIFKQVTWYSKDTPPSTQNI